MPNTIRNDLFAVKVLRNPYKTEGKWVEGLYVTKMQQGRWVTELITPSRDIATDYKNKVTEDTWRTFSLTLPRIIKPRQSTVDSFVRLGHKIE